MNSETPTFRKPNTMARAFNRVFGFLVGLGFGLPHNYLLEVRGRKSGRGRRFLVAARGRTQWVRNVEATGEVTLKKGRTRQRFRLRPVPDKEKPELLKAYLDRFKLTVQRYFPVPAGSDPQAFVDVAAQYPVFELIPSDSRH